jgi:hypothetical protein
MRLLVLVIRCHISAVRKLIDIWSGDGLFHSISYGGSIARKGRTARSRQKGDPRLRTENGWSGRQKSVIDIVGRKLAIEAQDLGTQ